MKENRININSYSNYMLPYFDDIINRSGALFYDCDGVLTDNRVLTDEHGVESVFFNRSDGLAIAHFRSLGINQAIISTETNPVVARRAEKLQIPVVHKLDIRALDKGSVLKTYAEQNAINLQYSIFIGNDINDIPALELVGYPCCPSDAEEEVKNLIRQRLGLYAKYEQVGIDAQHGHGWIANTPGGYGVVRELMRVLLS